MSAPLPVTVKTPFANDALPAAATAPISPSCDGHGGAPDADWIEKRPVRPDPGTSASRVASVMTTFVLSGPGLFHTHWPADTGLYMHSQMCSHVVPPSVV